MTANAMTGWVQTVRGRVSPDALGVTLMHEHLLLDLRAVFVEPEHPAERALARAPLTLDNLSFVTKHFWANLDNLLLSDPRLAVHEAGMFRDAGGGTLVDVTSIGLRRDPPALRAISAQTGLNVVMGTGYYHALFHPADMDARSEDALCAEMVRDIEEGADGTDIRAGIIGEVGCTWPLLPNERKALRATARAQRLTGAAVSIHPGLHVDSPFEILDILEAAGADPARVVMGHMERTGLARPRLLDLLRRGCCVEYDWFGEVRPTWPYGRIDVPSDGERIKEIMFLVAEGFGDRVVVSQDVCFKMRLASYGGPGYAHILRYVRPWMLAMGMREREVDDLLINNPRRILAFA